MKKIIGIILAVISVLIFISLYVLVICFQQDYIKYIVTILGYISVVSFTVSIFLISNQSSKGDKKDVTK